MSAEAKTSELVATLERVSASHAEDMQRVQQQLVAQKQLATKCSDEVGFWRGGGGGGGGGRGII